MSRSLHSTALKLPVFFSISCPRNDDTECSHNSAIRFRVLEVLAAKSMTRLVLSLAT